ncbi:NAD(P)H-dependent oxidoreductase [Reichenbachiella versicolor]|uniref:NAD(P)H-dependent oxidoreductase n=1 Tax=Reichenbachiella versicolor TaxID=1821036 RepID=UPI000D6E81B9|nr:NAD(P)H-dependent oxidoreductase [Reichenbachiella versicolor]
MGLIDNLNWRYATKAFDQTKKISSEQLDQLKEAVRLSASSYGLQAYKVLIIEDQAIKDQLVPASWGQKQVADASHVFVFCNNTSVGDTEIDSYLDLKSKVNNIPSENLKGYGDFMKSKITELPEDVLNNWTARQTYIAATNLMSMCAELEVDSCPMEGFDPAQYNEILGLNDKNLNAVVVVPVGYRSEEDATQHAAKVRKPAEELFELI